MRVKNVYGRSIAGAAPRRSRISRARPWTTVKCGVRIIGLQHQESLGRPRRDVVVHDARSAHGEVVALEQHGRMPRRLCSCRPECEPTASPLPDGRTARGCRSPTRPRARAGACASSLRSGDSGRRRRTAAREIELAAGVREIRQPSAVRGNSAACNASRRLAVPLDQPVPSSGILLLSRRSGARHRVLQHVGQRGRSARYDRSMSEDVRAPSRARRCCQGRRGPNQ